MPFVPVPLIAEATLLYDYDEQDVRTVLHFYQAGGGEWETDSLLALCNDLNEQWGTVLQPYFGPAVDYLGSKARGLVTEDAPAVEVPLGTALAGTMAGDIHMPPNVSLAVKKLTGLSGRSHRGRIYHFGFTAEALINPGQVTGVFAGGLADAYDTFFAGLSVMSTLPHHAVVSRFSGVANVIVDGRYKRRPIPRAEGIYTEVTSYFADRNLDSQRRRLPGRGR